jgi:pimeloyl-ACP methyl ester carboxylesterase
MAKTPEFHPVRRGFVEVEGREMHYRMLGSGPPALFIHSSPTNSSYVLPEMQSLGHAYTCIAFDTPGFGMSDPLPQSELTVGDLADAIAAAMIEIALPPLPVYGTHSGAAIALELGSRHPEKVTGLVLDGVPVFTRAEVAPLRGDGYFAPLVIDRLGGHYASTWTRFRDQSVWFPWCMPSPDHINEYDLATPEMTHRWSEMFFAAAAHYKPAYWAVTSYCEGAIDAADTLSVPAVFTATDADMLYPHLKRLPPLREDQEIVTIGNDHARKRALIGEGFARFGSPSILSDPARPVASSDRVRRQFVMDDARAQMVRYVGGRTQPVCLILHDVPGAGRMIEAEMLASADSHFVIVPDLPGSGDSGALAEGADLSAYAQTLWRTCDLLGVERVAIRGYGLSASLAVEMAALAPERCTALEIDGLYAPTSDERSAIREHFAPRIAVQPDGAHWYRLWLMLRDSQVYWPWYDTRRVALRRVPESFAGGRLHDWAVEVMKQHTDYHRLIEAILDHDAPSALTRLSTAPTILPPSTPVGHAYACVRSG